MTSWLHAFGPLALGWLVVILAGWPVLALRRLARLAAVAALAATALLLPWTIPPADRFARFLAAVGGITCAVKLYDLHRTVETRPRPGFASYLGYLFTTLSIVHRRLDEHPPRPVRVEARALAVQFANVLASLALFVVLYRLDWSRVPFALEHCAKFLALFLVIVPLSDLAATARRLFGASSPPMMNGNPFLARTPADVWRRYNNTTHRFFHTYLFYPFGGRRHPLRAILLVFAFSALIHEYVFLPPIGRIQGYQTAFFLVQGLAVVATVRLRPRGPWILPAILATLAFNLATSALFFASVDQVVPFYDRGRSTRPIGPAVALAALRVDW